MTVKDLIWVSVAQSKHSRYKVKVEQAKIDAEAKNLEVVMLAIADLRAIALDTNAYVRASVMAGPKKTRIKTLDVNELPSNRTIREREQKAAESKMTPEERALARFNRGEKYTP